MSPTCFISHGTAGLGWALIVALTFSSANGQTTYFVDDDAQAAGDGSSWQTAFIDPRDALDAAVAGDEVWIADGSYVAFTDSYDVAAGVHIYGGFRGDEASVDDRELHLYKTDFTAQTASYEQPVGLFVFAGGDAESIVDGLSLRRSAGGIASYTVGNTSAIKATDSTVLVRNCVFRQNGRAADIERSDVRFEDCDFVANFCFTREKAANCPGGCSGGAMSIYQSTVDLIRCRFVANSAGDTRGHGGALRIWHSTVRAINCVFAENHGGGPCFEFPDQGEGDGSAVYVSGSTSKVLLAGCLFHDNVGSTSVFIPSNAASEVYVVNSTLADNYWYVGREGVLQLYNSILNTSITANPAASVTVSACSRGDISLPPQAVIDATFFAEVPFRDADANDYRIASEWAGVGAGLPTFVFDSALPPSLPLDGSPAFAVDLARSPRVALDEPCDFPPDSPSCDLLRKIDIGAYEYVQPGDGNMSFGIDLADYGEWSECLTGPFPGTLPLGCGAFDFDGDFDADLHDMGLFQIAISDASGG
jgi:Right handed beta helix region